MSKTTTRLLGGDQEFVEDAEDRTLISTVVQAKVMATLGRPPGLFNVTVRRLWDNHYRVNVLIGSDPTTVRIAHSYFVVVGVKGEILSATPQINRLYV